MHLVQCCSSEIADYLRHDSLFSFRRCALRFHSIICCTSFQFHSCTVNDAHTDHKAHAYPALCLPGKILQACALKLTQVNINSGNLSSTPTQETQGKYERITSDRRKVESKARKNRGQEEEDEGKTKWNSVFYFIANNKTSIWARTWHFQLTMTIPPDCSAVHILMIGAIPIVVPWK